MWMLLSCSPQILSENPRDENRSGLWHIAIRESRLRNQHVFHDFFHRFGHLLGLVWTDDNQWYSSFL